MRAALVLFHRYVGLAMAGFLVIAGVTGSLLAWNDELEAAISPALFVVVPPAPDAPMRDPLELRAVVERANPDALVNLALLDPEPGRALVVRVQPRPGGPALGNDEIFVDPYRGTILGSRKWGDISQGMKNFMPFVDRLHYTLALGVFGTILFGIVALAWTLDCFVGVLLTLPRTRTKGWLGQWGKAWRLRMGGGGYKLNVDLHRAGGLWTWSLLFVLAWSSVAFNLRTVYDPVMRAMFATQAPATAPGRTAPLLEPPIGWAEARMRGRASMAAEARQAGFVIEREYLLFYNPRNATYRYAVRSDLDVSDRWGITSVTLSAIDGRRIAAFRPTGAATGDSITTWITTLHLTALWGVPFKIVMMLMGLVVTMLSVTGIVIWWRKRKARGVHAVRRGRRVVAGTEVLDAAE